jgi:hypothetical protein
MKSGDYAPDKKKSRLPGRLANGSLTKSNGLKTLHNPLLLYFLVAPPLLQQGHG